MNADIRLSVGFFEHHKTRKLQRRFGPEVVLSLLKLWVSTAKVRSDGILHNMDREDVGIMAGRGEDAEVFAQTLIDLNWVDEKDDKNGSKTLQIHDWVEHNSYAADDTVRSGENRFKVLARYNKPMYDKLKKKGTRSINKKEFREYSQKNLLVKLPVNTKTLTSRVPVDDSEGTSVVDGNTSSITPSPSPYPSPYPLPNPYPTPKEVNSNSIKELNGDAAAVGSMGFAEFAELHRQTLGVALPETLFEEVNQMLASASRNRLRQAWQDTAARGGRTFAYFREVVRGDDGKTSRKGTGMDFSFLQEVDHDQPCV